MLTTSVRGLAKSVPRARTNWDSNSPFAAHEDFLHFLGGLVFVVFAQIAVAAGHGNLLGIGGNGLLHQLGVFVFAPLQALPGNEEGGFLPGLLARNHGLHGRVAFDDARQQRALVHVVETRRKLQGAGQVLDDLQVGRADQFDEEGLVVENIIAQFVGALLVELVAFHGREHGAEDLGAEDVGKGIGPFAGQPEEQFAAGLMLADEAGQQFLERVRACRRKSGHG